jgi:phosphate-selective porin OprO/OprP
MMIQGTLKAALLTLVMMLMLPAPAVQGQDQDDMQTTLEALKSRIRDQERRIAELEAKTDQAHAAEIRREEIKSILAEINEELDSADPHGMKVYWKNGLNFASNDGNFKATVGGRVYIDWGWIDGSGIEDDSAAGIGSDLEDGIEFRTARLKIAGQMYKNIKYQIEYDLAPSRAAPKDIYMAVTKLPYVGNVKIGHFKEPFGLEELTSSRFITFMERSLANVLVPGRNMGVMVHNTAFDERMTWAVGLFRDTDDYGNVSSDGGYNVTGRVTWLPWYEDDGRKLVHLGTAYSYRTPNDDASLRYRQRPEAHFISQRFVDTGSFAADNYHLLGAEAALVYGPFSIQSEYVTSLIEAESGSQDTCFSGWYVQASYFLTGEHRAYSKSKGAFDRVKPKKNFQSDGSGWGAWEVAARYSFVDLGGDQLLTAASADDIHNVTLGLNWYLNPQTRIMANYIRSCPDRIDTADAADIFMLRFQYDF